MQVNASTLRELSPDKVQEVLSNLSATQLKQLKFDWSFWASPEQLAPPGDWNTWFLNAGRGFGKNRTGAES